MRFIKTFLRAVICLAAIANLTILSAQDSQEYPKVNEVRVEFDGFKSVSEEFVFSNVQLRSGMNYNTALVDQSIRTLYGTGHFEFVEVKVENSDDGSVDVIFEVIPKYTIERITYSGNNKYKEGRLSSKGELEAGVPLDEYQVSEAADKIQAYYVKKGYPDVKVDYRIRRDEDTGFAVVLFDIDEGTNVKIKGLGFEGNDSIESKKLAKVLETKKRGWLSWLTGSGRFDEVKFKEDLELLRTYYRNQGYLDVVVDADDVILDFKTDQDLYITIRLTEGERYTVGEMSIENATIFTEGELIGAVEVESGDPFSPEKVDQAATAVREYYTSRGYLDAGVRAERVPNMATRAIDVVFRVRESEKFYVESIKVEGNTITKTRVIIRELALRPGDVFDLKRMETSENRLRNTRYFGDVRMNPEATNIPGRRDLSVTVSEGRTGNFTFGAGFGSVESAVVYFELTQGNFDLFNWRSGFRGAGQKFRFRASLGTTSNEVLIAFEEPWLFEQRLAFGVEIFRTESDYNSSDYNELRTGFELYLRRRLFELVEARVSYRLELVDIFDVDDDVKTYREAEGDEYVSSVGLTLLRDSRDSLMFTRNGNRTTLSANLAGVGGDVHYLKLEARSAQFFPTFDLYDQTLSIIGRVGTASPYGDSDDVPFYDRFYLGGPDSLRGFEYRDVSPRDEEDSSESVGGDTYGMLSFEYGWRLAEPLGLVAFYDCGFVNESDYDFSPSDYASNWGIGARIILMGSPLKLDLGFPITVPDDADDNGAQFNFSFGTRF
ncbi:MULTISPECIES: outer membrane protein assembly factor BamA [unclassified Lentimonas]|uniref:outer membrane protein assembly factor BamA n=1 Tax=unclassified Lentimonas TaxID=2630993 RepID=UPI001325DBA4|nr:MULTISPECIES: outer membrane protein assembly factor BamA [unclassified Lentimonas]CAA6678690.1 Outer membrane protein assembly factor YaeT precursor [Lentimonas sp. CC4]CAA6683676.1 Outer membrane protein assembly factor YaeT precursor [Lentimonas sp. CC6]CAA7074477.1 Outer membrane protein assembly factor YaeT precursor [Lentimonas sp. CC4]CAA7169087.1 Outer membrane protein assembly factor YaeT precursor [Lentimonas sp. CC21]CAA7180505.1 Outer membrane protein assembly factor YaeT precur